VVRREPAGQDGRVRTVPMPTWVKVAIDVWISRPPIADGFVFRPVSRGGQCCGNQLCDKVIWQMLRGYARDAGLPGIAAHDMRRTCAKLCRASRGELEQIQMLLGHASVQTTERYLGTKQDLLHAPNDGIKLHVTTDKTVDSEATSCREGQAPTLSLGARWQLRRSRRPYCKYEARTESR
jgi:integrase